MNRNNRIVHSLLISIVFIFVFCMCVLISSADVSAYTTDSWKTDIKVNKNYTFDYTETITVNFDSPQHGIFRYVPMGEMYKVKDISVEGDEYSVESTDGDKVIKIGSSSRTLSGKKTYKIRYTLAYARDHYNNADTIYIDLIPTEWQTGIDKFSVHMDLPEDFDTANFSFYTGSYGMTEDVEKYGSIEVNDEAKTVDIKGRDLPANCGITIYKVLNQGYWEPTYSYEWMKYLALVLMLLVIVYTGIRRVTVGRDPDIVPTVEFYPPEGMSPLDLGYIIDGTVDRKDITSLFFYLASKGYLKIHETYNRESFKFERSKIMEENEKESIKKFYKGVFGRRAFDADCGELIKKSSEMGSRMSTAYDAIPDIVETEFAGDKSLYTEASIIAYKAGKALFSLVSGLIIALVMMYYGIHVSEGLAVVFGFSVFVFVIGYILIEWMSSIHDHRKSRKAGKTTLLTLSCMFVYAIFAICVIVIVGSEEIGFCDKYVMATAIMFYILVPIFVLGMKARTAENARLLGQVIGFKSFIRNAELDKLNELVEEDPSYFYNILPYAYVFGLTKKWAANFEHIAIDNPDWYVPVGGYYSGMDRFDVVRMNSMFNNVSNTIDNAISQSKDSGSSSGGGWSSGGGGFSGGGGGGGGGGAW